MRLVEIVLFPVKGARGLRPAAADVTPRGLRGDRRWMLVDANGRFVSQREMPALARLVAEPNEGGLSLRLDGAALEVAIPSPEAPRRPVVIWRSVLELPEAGPAREWLTRAFGQPLGLFFQPEDAVRPVQGWAEPGDEVSLADGFPILVATTASLRAVQAAAGPSVGMDRFRPNLVVEGSQPWAEDTWARLRIGEVEIELVKPCERCKVTTIDQELGAPSGDEPLAALRGMRMSGDRRLPGVLFGWNAVPRRLGRIRSGDEVEVLAIRAPWPIRPQRASVPA